MMTTSAPSLDISEPHSPLCPSKQEEESHSQTTEDSSCCKINALPFPWQLHSVLEAASKEGFDHIVSWLEDNRSFKVHRPELFVKHIIPRFFNRQTKYKSFQRQLNIWQFERLIGTRGPCSGGYYHVHFRRHDASTLQLMKRERLRKPQHQSEANNIFEFFGMPVPTPNLVSKAYTTERLCVSDMPCCNERIDSLLQDSENSIITTPTISSLSCSAFSPDGESTVCHDHQSSTDFHFGKSQAFIDDFSTVSCSSQELFNGGAQTESGVSYYKQYRSNLPPLLKDHNNTHFSGSSISQDDWRYVLIGLQLASNKSCMISGTG